MRLNASAAVVLFYKSFWVSGLLVCHIFRVLASFLVRKRFGTTCVSHIQGVGVVFG
jgi:hypothetical protein